MRFKVICLLCLFTMPALWFLTGCTTGTHPPVKARDTVKEVRLIVNLDFDGVEPRYDHEERSGNSAGFAARDAYDVPRTILKALGYRVVPNQIDRCDATLTINLTFNALQGLYEVVGPRYTAAKVRGSMKFSVHGTQRLRTFQGSASLTKFVTESGGRSKDDAPFDDALLNSGYERKVAELVSSCLGVPRAKAILATLQCPSPSTFRTLTGETHSRDEAVIDEIAKMDHGLPALLDLLKGKNAETRQRYLAGHALTEKWPRDPRVFEGLLEVLQDNEADPELRNQVCYDLADIKDSRSVDALTRVLTNGSHEVQHGALIALEEIGGNSKTAEVLIRFTKDKQKPLYLRGAALNALGATRDKLAVDFLLEVLNSTLEQEDLRREAARGLGKSGASYAVPFLIAALDGCADPDDSADGFSNVVCWALRDLVGKDLGIRGSLWKEWWQKNKDDFSEEKPLE